MLPCPVTKAVKLGVGLIRSFSLPTMMGKKDFVIMWK